VSEDRAPIFAADAGSISAAAEILSNGGLVAFPTETVYGLGGDATNKAAIDNIYKAKGRPRTNPLIVHVKDTQAARSIVGFNETAEKLADAFWPGALTMVLERLDGKLCADVSAGLSTAAVRVPNHPVALALLEKADLPIAAPSANRAGRISPTAAGHVVFSLPGPDDTGLQMVLDGGPCQIGLESTVIDLTGATPALLRPGGLAVEDIEAVIGPLLMPSSNGPDNEAKKSPGMMDRHYAPELPLRLNAEHAGPGEVLLGFGVQAPAETMNLSPTGDLEEAAANLFAMIRSLDGPPFSAIAVMTIPETGLGRAINDRLRRATVSAGK